MRTHVHSALLCLHLLITLIKKQPSLTAGCRCVQWRHAARPRRLADLYVNAVSHGMLHGCVQHGAQQLTVVQGCMAVCSMLAQHCRGMTRLSRPPRVMYPHHQCRSTSSMSRQCTPPLARSHCRATLEWRTSLISLWRVRVSGRFGAVR